jgi:hypothetical protein
VSNEEDEFSAFGECKLFHEDSPRSRRDSQISIQQCKQMEEELSKIDLESLSYKIIGLAIEVHRH